MIKKKVNKVKKTTKKTPAKSSDVKNKVIKIIERIRPSLQMDGGDVHFIGFDEKSGIVKVELTGHCAHCPMSMITLKQGIEAEIKRSVKEVKEVKAIQL